MKYIQKFQVECGKLGFNFPIDMLRYDCCWPSNEVETPIFRAQEVEPGTRVWLTREVESKDAQPTKGRWESFGWKVVKVETQKS